MKLKFALCIGTFVAAFPAPAVETHPNNVFFLGDDMGWQETFVPSAEVLANHPPPACASS